ncbi:hypothetical protein Chor_009319 [Crotalus horridus]
MIYFIFLGPCFSFIRDRIQCCGDSERIEVTMAELDDSEAQACNPNTKSLSEMIEQVQMYPPKEVFFRVAAEMFSDGAFNWGRVVALFYFACKLILKVRRPPLLFRHPHLANHCCLCCGGLDCLIDLLEDVLILSHLHKEDLFITRTSLWLFEEVFIKTLWQQYAACSRYPASLEQFGRDNMSGEQANGEDEPDAAQMYSLKEHMFRIFQELRNNAEITR